MCNFNNSKVYNWVILSTLIVLCSNHHYLVPELSHDLIIAIIAGMRWDFIVSLICISLTSNDFENLLLWLLLIFLSSEISLFKTVVHFQIRWRYGWVITVNILMLSMNVWRKTFSHSKLSVYMYFPVILGLCYLIMGIIRTSEPLSLVHLFRILWKK